MATRTIRPAVVSYSGRLSQRDAADVAQLGSADPTALDWEAGVPLIAYTGGKVDLAALTTTIVTDANALLGLSAEPFDGSRYAGAVDGFKQGDIAIDRLFPGVLIEANVYVDGAGGASETLAQAMVNGKAILKQHSSGVFVFDTDTATSGYATFTVVSLVDDIGTINGRIMAFLDATYRLYA